MNACFPADFFPCLGERGDGALLCSESLDGCFPVADKGVLASSSFDDCFGSFLTHVVDSCNSSLAGLVSGEKLR